MNTLLKLSFTVFMCLLIFSPVSYSETVQGTPGSSSHWGSGWIDLNKVTTFKKGGKLIIRVGGTAKYIIVRLLAKNADPNDVSGVEGDIVSVPDSRVVEIILERTHKNIVQISVHGGRYPWGIFPLGGGNGPAMLVSLEYIKPATGK